MLRRAAFKEPQEGDWFIWSINKDTVSCLPYAQTDSESFFVYDLKHFPIEQVVNV